MNPVPASVKAPSLPQVNLLPPEVGERRTRSRLLRIAGVFALTFVVFLVMGFLLVDNLRRTAEDELAYEQEKMTALNTEIAQYRVVQELKDELTSAEQARQFVGATDVVRAEVAAFILGAMPEGSSLTEYSMSLTTYSSMSSGGTGPFSIPNVGTISFTANSPTFIDANQVELLLEANPVFVQARVVDASNLEVVGGDDDNAEGFELTGSITVTYDVFTERFSTSWYGTEEEAGTSEYYASLLEIARRAAG